jgi:hypothetical protein
MRTKPERPVDAERSSTSGRGFTLLLCAVSAALAVEVVLLVLENRRLREALAQEPLAPARERLRAGDVLEPFTLQNADGSLETIAFQPEIGPTLLLVFAQECPACPGVLQDWEREVVPDFLAASARVVGLRLDPGSQAPASTGFPVFTLADATEVPLEKLASVPLTVLLDRAGSVVFVRYGALEPEHKHELVRLLGES